jgi:hypothetical protein
MSENTTELIDLTLKGETAKAYFVEDDNGIDAWIPKSLVKNIELGSTIKSSDNRNLTEIVLLEIPTWLAEEKNL